MSSPDQRVGFGVQPGEDLERLRSEGARGQLTMTRAMISTISKVPIPCSTGQRIPTLAQRAINASTINTRSVSDRFGPISIAMGVSRSDVGDRGRRIARWLGDEGDAVHVQHFPAVVMMDSVLVAGCLELGSDQRVNRCWHFEEGVRMGRAKSHRRPLNAWDRSSP